MSLAVTDLQNTLLHLFHARGLGAGRQVPLLQVEQLWSITTLRRGDLLDAIVRLSATGQLGIDDQAGDTLLSLTPAGESGAHMLSGPEGMPWGQYLHGVLLPQLRQRQTATAPGGRGRRSYESRTMHQNAPRYLN
jgi:hypothetical protein